jgi:hypothetical protein
MKNLIETIENNILLTNHEKDLLIDSITLGGSVSVDVRVVQTELKMAILEILHNAEYEMTISEIQDAFAEIYGHTYTVQRFSAMARQLRNMGLVEKNYLITGNLLIINGKKYPEKIAKFFLKNS